jgi:hypothetical protein
MSLKGLFKMAVKKKDVVRVVSKGQEKFQIAELRHPNFDGNQGLMNISLELVPQRIATQIPVGFGRSDPNANPFLPEPEGRISLVRSTSLSLSLLIIHTL